jgi:hypothetical protein
MTSEENYGSNTGKINSQPSHFVGIAMFASDEINAFLTDGITRSARRTPDF